MNILSQVCKLKEYEKQSSWYKFYHILILDYSSINYKF